MHMFETRDDYYLNEEEVRYSFVHNKGLTSGGTVEIQREKRDHRAIFSGKQVPVWEIDVSLVVHKNALIAFVADLVRDHRVAQAEGLGDLQALGL